MLANQLPLEPKGELLAEPIAGQPYAGLHDAAEHPALGLTLQPMLSIPNDVGDPDSSSHILSVKSALDAFASMVWRGKE